jgi:hypothetical protein
MKIKITGFLLAFIVSLSLLWLFPCLVKAADPIEIHSGETMSGDIAINGQMDSYTFQGTTGQGIVIEMDADGSGLGPAFYLYGPDGTIETKVVGGYNDMRIRLEDYQLKQTGIYTIVAAASGGWDTTGKYGLSLVLIGGSSSSQQDPDGGSIASGQTQSAAINPNGDTDIFTFQGTTGQGIVIEMAADGSGLGPALYLYGPDGIIETKVVGGYNATRIRLEDYQLKQKGIYTIVAAASGGWDTTGKYGLSLVVIGTGVASSTPAASVTPGLTPTTAPSPTPAAPSLPSDTFTGSVPLPSQVSTDPKVIGTNALLTSLMVVIFYFAAALFNGTFKENYGTIQSWIKRVRASLKLPRLKTDSRPQSARKSTQYLEIIFIVLVTAAINCVIDTSFGFSQSGLIIFTAMVATVIASTYSYNGIRVLITRYGFHIPATIKAYPLAILLAIVFVIISRLIAFHPGFIFGFVGAFTILPSAVVPDKRQASIGILWGVLVVIFLALVAFLLREPLASMANGFWQSMLDTILVALFVGGLERLLFGLVPATFLDGGTLASWKKLIWFIVFGLVVFLFVHIVVNKSNALTSAVKDMKVISMVCLVAICFVLSLLFWLYFRIRAIQNRRRRLHG